MQYFWIPFCVACFYVSPSGTILQGHPYLGGHPYPGPALPPYTVEQAKHSFSDFCNGQGWPLSTCGCCALWTLLSLHPNSTTT